MEIHRIRDMRGGMARDEKSGDNPIHLSWHFLESNACLSLLISRLTGNLKKGSRDMLKGQPLHSRTSPEIGAFILLTQIFEL